MFKRKVDTKQAIAFSVAGLVAAALLPPEWNPVVMAKNAITAAMKKKAGG